MTFLKNCLRIKIVHQKLLSFYASIQANKNSYLVIIVLAMNLVGSLLISALVIFPALSAMRVFKSFRSVTICSAVFSVVCAALGIVISVLAGTPVGSTIVGADMVGFFVFWLIGAVRR